MVRDQEGRLAPGTLECHNREDCQTASQGGAPGLRSWGKPCMEFCPGNVYFTHSFCFVLFLAQLNKGFKLAQIPFHKPKM